jgi:hypothetical protein
MRRTSPIKVGITGERRPSESASLENVIELKFAPLENVAPLKSATLPNVAELKLALSENVADLKWGLRAKRKP